MSSTPLTPLDEFQYYKKVTLITDVNKPVFNACFPYNKELKCKCVHDIIDSSIEYIQSTEFVLNGFREYSVIFDEGPTCLSFCSTELNYGKTMLVSFGDDDKIPEYMDIESLEHKIYLGDILSKINNEDCLNLPIEECMMRIEYSPSPLTLHFWTIHDTMNDISLNKTKNIDLMNSKASLDKYIYSYISNYHITEIQEIYQRIYNEINQDTTSEEVVMKILKDINCQINEITNEISNNISCELSIPELIQMINQEQSFKQRMNNYKKQHQKDKEIFQNFEEKNSLRPSISSEEFKELIHEYIQNESINSKKNGLSQSPVVSQTEFKIQCPSEKDELNEKTEEEIKEISTTNTSLDKNNIQNYLDIQCHDNINKCNNIIDIVDEPIQINEKNIKEIETSKCNIIIDSDHISQEETMNINEISNQCIPNMNEVSTEATLSSEILSFNEDENLINTAIDVDDQSDILQENKSMNVYEYAESPLRTQLYNEDIEDLYRIIHKILLTPIYIPIETIMNRTFLQRNINIRYKCNILRTYGQPHHDIPARFQSPHSYKECQFILKKLDHDYLINDWMNTINLLDRSLKREAYLSFLTYMYPYSTLGERGRIIHQVEEKEDKRLISGDIYFCILMYIVAQTSLFHYCNIIILMTTFMSDYTSKSSECYILSSLNAAITYIETHSFPISDLHLYTFKTYNEDIDNISIETTYENPEVLPINLNALFELIMDPIYGIARYIESIENNCYVFQGEILIDYLQLLYADKSLDFYVKIGQQLLKYNYIHTLHASHYTSIIEGNIYIKNDLQLNTKHDSTVFENSTSQSNDEEFSLDDYYSLTPFQSTGWVYILEPNNNMSLKYVSLTNNYMCIYDHKHSKTSFDTHYLYPFQQKSHIYTRQKHILNTYRLISSLSSSNDKTSLIQQSSCNLSLQQLLSSYFIQNEDKEFDKKSRIVITKNPNKGIYIHENKPLFKQHLTSSLGILPSQYKGDEGINIPVINTNNLVESEHIGSIALTIKEKYSLFKKHSRINQNENNEKLDTCIINTSNTIMNTQPSFGQYDFNIDMNTITLDSNLLHIDNEINKDLYISKTKNYHQFNNNNNNNNNKIEHLYTSEIHCICQMNNIIIQNKYFRSNLITHLPQPILSLQKRYQTLIEKQLYLASLPSLPSSLSSALYILNLNSIIVYSKEKKYIHLCFPNNDQFIMSFSNENLHKQWYTSIKQAVLYSNIPVTYV